MPPNLFHFGIDQVPDVALDLEVVLLDGIGVNGSDRGELLIRGFFLTDRLEVIDDLTVEGFKPDLLAGVVGDSPYELPAAEGGDASGGDGGFQFGGISPGGGAR